MERKEETPNAALLRRVVSAYTENPAAVEIVPAPIRNGGVQLNLRVGPNDHPKVVGGMGKHITALRTLFLFIGARDKTTLRVMLLEPERGDKVHVKRERNEVDEEVRARFFSGGGETHAAYDAAEIQSLFEAVLGRIFAKPFRTDIYDGEDKVMLEFVVDPTETELAEGILPYLAAIFHGIGRNHGRDLYVERQPYIEIPR